MMDVLSKIFLWVLYASISASAISLLIILLERLFRKKLGVRIHHALWILVLIRLLVPVMPGSPINLFNLIPEDVQHILDFTKNTVSTTSADAFEKRAYLSNLPADPLADAAINNQPMKISAVPESEALQEGVKWSIPEIASIVWVTGLFSIALFYIIITMSFYKSIIMSRKPADKEIVSLLESCMIKAKQRKRIAVYTEKGLKSPYISGIFKTAIYLPEGILEAIDHQQLSNVLLHELAHHKRKDVLFNLLGTVAVIVHWFNPIVWICVKRMKFVRELACDTYVLEMIGEEKNIHYGETIINLSKLYLNSPGKLTLVSFFETKNQIEKRITMIKRFRKNNYKITAAAIVCVIVASAFTLTIALSPDSAEKEKVHQMDTQDTAAIVTPKEQPQKEESKFLIDDAVKVYSDIKKVEQVAGFKFKVPAYMPVGYKADGFQLLKASKEANVLKVFYRTENNKKRSFSYEFLTSTINPSKFLPENARNQFIGEADKINVDIESNSTAFDIGALKGSKLTIKQVFKGPKPLEIVSTYFVWQDKETECAIKYNETIKNSSGTTTIWLDLPQKDVERIALSIQYPDEKLENSIYKGLSPEVSTEIAQLPIYDKEDLQKAKGMLGFNLKFPINIPGDFKATMAHVGITANSDIKNKKILYELNMVYRNGKSFIAFTQRKDGAVYDEAARNGTIVFKNGGPNSPQMIKVESLKGYEKAVFRYELRPEVIVYTWKEDGFYCEVSFIDCQDNVEDALKSIIDEKPYKLD